MGGWEGGWDAEMQKRNKNEFKSSVECSTELWGPGSWVGLWRGLVQFLRRMAQPFDRLSTSNGTLLSEADVRAMSV